MRSRVDAVRILPASFPLKNVFRTHLGQKKETRNILVALECSDGVEGLGEASGSLALPESKQETMLRVLQSAARDVMREPPREWPRLSAALRKKYPGHPTAVSALECALLDADCKSRKKSLAAFFGGARKTVETYYTVPALPLPDCRKIIRKMAGLGLKLFKVKVDGRRAGEDFERVNLVKKQVANPSLIVDANQGWDPRGCLNFSEKMAAAGLPVKLLEQPLPKNDLRGMAFVKKRSPFPLAADESFRSLEDVQKILDRDGADVFNLKIAKCGLAESLKIVSYLKKWHVRRMIGCMMESPLGLAASVHWACGSGDFSFVDLDSFLLLQKTDLEGGFSARGARLSVRAGARGCGLAGLGLEP